MAAGRAEGADEEQAAPVLLPWVRFAAPHPGEILIALAASAQGRPQERLAPLSTEQ